MSFELFSKMGCFPFGFLRLSWRWVVLFFWLSWGLSGEMGLFVFLFLCLLPHFCCMRPHGLYFSFLYFTLIRRMIQSSVHPCPASSDRRFRSIDDSVRCQFLLVPVSRIHLIAGCQLRSVAGCWIRPIANSAWSPVASCRLSDPSCCQSPNPSGFRLSARLNCQLPYSSSHQLYHRPVGVPSPADLCFLTGRFEFLHQSVRALSHICPSRQKWPKSNYFLCALNT